MTKLICIEGFNLKLPHPGALNPLLSIQGCEVFCLEGFDSETTAGEEGRGEERGP
jgi:hypothetical protein